MTIRFAMRCRQSAKSALAVAIGSLRRSITAIVSHFISLAHRMNPLPRARGRCYEGLAKVEHPNG